MADKLPLNVAAIPYLKGALSGFYQDPGTEFCTSLQPCGTSKNKDGSTSYNYVATMEFVGDGGSYTDKVNVSLIEKDGKYTLYKGDVTEHKHYDLPSDKTTVTHPAKKNTLEAVEAVKGMPAQTLRAEHEKFDKKHPEEKKTSALVPLDTPVVAAIISKLGNSLT